MCQVFNLPTSPGVSWFPTHDHRSRVRVFPVSGFNHAGMRRRKYIPRQLKSPQVQDVKSSNHLDEPLYILR